MHIPFPVHSHLRCKSTTFIHHRQGNRRKGRPKRRFLSSDRYGTTPHIAAVYTFPNTGAVCFSVWNRAFLLLEL